MTVEELQVLITAKTDALRKEIEMANENIDSIGRTATKTQRGMVSAFLKGTLAAKVVSKAVGLISTNLGGAISRLDTLNNYTKVMDNLGVSSEDAKASIDRMSDKLLGLPTTLDDAALSVQRFTSANGNVKASTEMFLALNNAILAGGAPMEAQRTALEQLSQSYAKGKPDMMEWRSAMTAMPAQLKQVAEAMGYVNADALGEALRSGKLSMDDFMIKLVELNKKGANGYKSLEEQARASTGGVATSIANLKNSFTRGITSIMDAIGQSNIAGFFQGIASVINKTIPYIVGFTKAVVWAVSSIGSLFGKKPQSHVKKISDGMKNLGATAGGKTSKGIDKATGSAKKLKKELNGLASFDEMNILSESANNDSGGDSDGSVDMGAGLGGLDLSAFDTDISKVGDKSEEIAELIKGKFIALKGVITSIWDSDPVQAFVNASKSYLSAFGNFFITIYEDIKNNSIATWENISGNVRGAIDNMLSFWTQFWNDASLTIETWSPQIINGISSLFNSIWADYIDPYLQLITKVWEDFTKILLDNWNKYGKPLLNNIGEFYTKVVELFQKIWDDIIGPIVTPFLETLSWLWDKHLKKLVDEVISFVLTLYNSALEIYNKFIHPIVTWIMDTFAPVWSFLSSLIIGVVGTIVGITSDLASGIFRVLKGIINFITGFFTDNWKKAWQGVKDIFGGIFDGIAGMFKAPINFIIDGINAFISGINKIKIPDWVPGVGGTGFHIGKIPKLARGGVISQSTIAQIGENGKEVVMPLERNTGWINLLAEKINSKSNNSQPIQLIFKLGEETIFNKFIDAQERRRFENNGEVVYGI